MEVSTKIDRPLDNEHVIGMDPPLRPSLPEVWRRRINPFAGRAISDRALTAEQDQRSGMQRLRGLAIAPGVVEGMEITLDREAIGSRPEDAMFQIAHGLGITKSGEDVSIGAAQRMAMGDLRVVIRTDHDDMLESGGDPPPDEEDDSDIENDGLDDTTTRLRPARPRRMSGKLADIAQVPQSSAIPHVGILLAQPITTTIVGRPDDDCDPDPRDDPYTDLQRIDGTQLVLYLWPNEVTSIEDAPDYSLPPVGDALRNQLAYRVFDTERLQEPGDMHPWEDWGVPVALAGFSGDWSLEFIDMAAVTRTGGTPLPRTSMAAGTGEPRLWQARIDQFVEHLTGLEQMDDETLRNVFVHMPPTGVLPADQFDPVLRRQHFFPGNYGVSAVPIPKSNINIAIREAAQLSSLKRGAPDRVELLVPVPDEFYEPGLLEVEVEDPRFAETISAFQKDRQHWLIQRESVRRRFDKLSEVISGNINGWPSLDLTQEENNPNPYKNPPSEITHSRRFNENSAARTHSLRDAGATLPISKGDHIWFWMRIHSAQNLTGLSLRVGRRPGDGAAGPFEAGVYWGQPNAMPIASEPAGLTKRRVGNVPKAGIWQRIEIPADRIWNHKGDDLRAFNIDSVEFTQRGGQVEWGSFGKIDSNGDVYTYFANDAPIGSKLSVSGTTTSGWPWQPIADRTIDNSASFGVISDAGVCHISALDAFRAKWSSPFIIEDLAAIDEDGIDGFVADVKRRLEATNDAIDLGFVRARADIYRVRQIMLGADAASRLVTSPSLADLASRDEGARATSKGIAEYLTASVKRKPEDVIIDIGPKPTTRGGSDTGSGANAGGGGGSGTHILRGMTFMPGLMTLNVTPPAPTPTPRSSGVRIAGTTVPTTTPFTPQTITPMFLMPTAFGGQTVFSQASNTQQSVNLAHLGVHNVQFQPSDIQSQLPVAGLVERTVSIAERLKPPPAVQALNYAMASKAVVVQTLGGLAKTVDGRPNGIPLRDMIVPGFHHKSKPKTDPAYFPNVGQLAPDLDKADADREYVDADQLPPEEKRHEADYFTAAVQAIDNSIAMMRLVEGRVAQFEALAKSVEDLRRSILQSTRQVESYLRNVDIEVEEARHDLSVAERLRAEEIERVDSTNVRRAAILADHVHAIAYRRVREVDHLVDAPIFETYSGLAEDPVVACRREHDDVPEEIDEYVELMHEAPVKWFPGLNAAVDRVKRLEAARTAIRRIRDRARLRRTFATRQTSRRSSRIIRGVWQAMAARQDYIVRRQTLVSQVGLSGLTNLSLAQSHIQIREMASISDLLEGRHRASFLTRLAAREIEGIAQIAGCLHTGFGEVAPAVRLAWAEILSEFDRPAPLQSLSGLPRWPEVPMDLRRTLQGFVDWLFGRIDNNNEEAHDAMNELVRIALLMAAHAPVDRIIPARLVAPVPARVGGRFQLAVDARLVRRGMVTLIRNRQEQVVSRAVVDDISNGHATAVLVQNFTAINTISTDMRFQLITGTG